MDALPKYETNVAPKKKPQSRRQSQQIKWQKTRWNWQDITMAIIPLVVFLLGCMIILIKSNQGAAVTAQLNSVTTQLDQTRNKNNDLKQEISNLTNPNRLGKIADKNGLSLQNQNIRNVK